MRASLLSLALSALLITAAPTSDPQSENQSLDRIQKRGFIALYTPNFNGQPTTPGTQIQPGVWIGSNTIQICNLSCLDPKKPQTAQAKCVDAKNKCLSGGCSATSCVNAIIKSNIYVQDNDATKGYWGNELVNCPAPAAPRTVCYLPLGGTPTVLNTVFP